MKMSSRTGQSKRRGITLAVLLITAVATGLATDNGLQGPDDDRDREGDDQAAYSIGLWGDTPYSATQAATGVPNLIADMNRHHLAFSVHDGDLKTGNGAPVCDDALYTQALAYFNALKAP